MGQKLDDKDMQILELFVDADGPLGSWLVANRLADQGVEQSLATIGRSLNKLERAGCLVQKDKNRGRVITEEGLRALAMNQHIKDLTTQTLQLGKYLAPEMLEDFHTVLEVRRIIEAGTARLAALRATPEEIRQMERLLDQEEEKYKTTWINQLDLDFHKAIVKSAKNAVLESLYSQIIGMGQQSSAFEYLRKKINAGFVSKHHQILEAIKSGDPDAAEAAMLSHIDTLIEDVNIYYRTYLKNQPAKQASEE